MSTYSGSLMAALALASPASGITPDLGDFTHPPVAGVAAGVSSISSGSLHGSGLVVIPNPSHFAGTNPDGVSAAGLWFEQIFFRFSGNPFGKPLAKDVGVLLTQQSLTVEVWNAYRASSKTLQDIVIIGASLSVPDAPVLPKTFNPLQSFTYHPLVEQVGPPVIDNDLTFDFSGIGEPTGNVSGTRLVAFPFEPDWDTEVQETKSYLTNIIVFDSGSEQRTRLRNYPRRSLSYTVAALSPQEQATLERTMWAFMGQAFGVPLWQHASRLVTSLAAGANASIFCDTADREFVAGGLVLLWSDYQTWEAVPVVHVLSDHLDVTGAILHDGWSSLNTLVIPLRYGVLQDTISTERLTADFTRVPVLFDMLVAP